MLQLLQLVILSVTSMVKNIVTLKKEPHVPFHLRSGYLSLSRCLIIQPSTCITEAIIHSSPKFKRIVKTCVLMHLFLIRNAAVTPAGHSPSYLDG